MDVEERVEGPNWKLRCAGESLSPENNRYKEAITRSAELAKQNKSEEALTLLDEAIAEAIQKQKISLLCALCHHAAIIARFTENLPLTQKYYEQSLASDPENGRALYGLATLALDQEKPELAKQYAVRSYKAILQSDNEILKEGLLDLIAKRWPDITGEYEKTAPSPCRLT